MAGFSKASKGATSLKDLALAINILVRMGVAFIGFIYLFSQLFFGDFQWPSTAAGLGGMVLAAITGWPHRLKTTLNRIGIVAGSIALLGVGAGVYNYYAYYNIPGNYHAWFITLPYTAGVIFLMIAAARGQTLR